ncbi:MAG: hypothetical protein WDW36_003933 [Sanguina aurantia]
MGCDLLHITVASLPDPPCRPLTLHAALPCPPRRPAPAEQLRLQGTLTDTAQGSSSGSKLHPGSTVSLFDADQPRIRTSNLRLLLHLRALAVLHDGSLEGCTQAMLTVTGMLVAQNTSAASTDQEILAALPICLHHCATHLSKAMPVAQGGTCLVSHSAATRAASSVTGLKAGPQLHSLLLWALDTPTISRNRTGVAAPPHQPGARAQERQPDVRLPAIRRTLHTFRSMPGSLVLMECALRQQAEGCVSHELVSRGFHVAAASLALELTSSRLTARPVRVHGAHSSVLTTLNKLLQLGARAAAPFSAGQSTPQAVGISCSQAAEEAHALLATALTDLLTRHPTCIGGRQVPDPGHTSSGGGGVSSSSSSSAPGGCTGKVTSRDKRHTHTASSAPSIRLLCPQEVPRIRAVAACLVVGLIHATRILRLMAKSRWTRWDELNAPWIIELQRADAEEADLR